MKIYSSWKLIIVFLSINYYTTAQYYSSVKNIDTSSATLQKFNVADGLSQGTIYCTFQDSKGFLWFGTQFGLNRFDGYTYKVFLNNPSDSTSISGNQVSAITEDSSGYLWIGTTEGLNQYDPDKNVFRHFLNSPADSGTISSNNITSLVIDDSGNLWAGTYCGGLNYLPLDKKSNAEMKFIHFRTRQNNAAEKNDVIRSLFKDDKGRIWIGSEKGLMLLEDKGKERFRQIIKINNSDQLLQSNIWTINEYNSDRILIGSSSGIYLVDERIDGSFSLVRFFDALLMKDFGSVISLGKDNSGNLRIGTAGNGMYVWNEDKNLLSKISAKDRRFDLSAATIYSILSDRSQVLWMGTKTGLLKRNYNNTFFSSYHHSSGDRNSLSDNVVFSFMEDNLARVWIGTETGINIFDPAADEFSNARFVNTSGHLIRYREIKCIFQDSEGIVWIGTMWDGLIKINKELSRNSKYETKGYWYKPSRNGNLFNYAVFCIKEDNWGNLWIGTNEGIKIFNKTEGKFNSLEKMQAGDISPPKGIIFDIYLSPSDSGVIWAATESEGLFKFEPGNHKNKIRCTGKYKPWGAANTASIRSVLEDSFKQIWIGTLNSGLYVINRGGKTKNFNVLNGLSNNAVTGIREDNMGNVWISTISGLNRYDRQSGEFMNFYADDGIEGNEFNGGASLKNSKGDIYFGGTDGFTIIHPEKVQKNLIVPEINITDIRLFNKSINKQDYLIRDANQGSLKNSGEELNFLYDQNVLSFEFSALHYVNPSSNRYAYMLEGVDTAWIYTSQSRNVTYAHLTPGTYIFRVKGSNNNNVWNHEGTSLKFIISPPFWSTWWFRAMLIILIFVSSVLIYKKRIQSIELKKRELEEQVKEKSEAEQRMREMLTEVEILKGKLENENIYLKDEIKLVHNFEDIISISEKFKKVLSRVEQVSSTDSTVLILGESGTGKELLARAIHNLSQRKNRPLIKVDCSTLSASLIESELFGHEKGAFTGAMYRKPGRFELADRGTIFLDEIGELPLEMQTKLLRVLQDGEFERLGSTISTKVDVRIISATNRDIEDAVQSGKFREDLFYRLNVFPIKVPALRERKEDIPYLVSHFISKHSKKAGKKFELVNGRIMEELSAYDWPGNIRELENIIERAVIVSCSGKLTLESPLANKKNSQNNNGFGTLEEAERLHIINILNKTEWRVSGQRGAAKILGLKPTTLEYKMKKLGIHRG